MPVTAHAVDPGRTENAPRLSATCADVEVLVNNAGSIPVGGIEKVDDGRWREDRVLKVFGYVSMMRALSPR